MEAMRPTLTKLRLFAPSRAPRPLYRCLHTSASRHATPLPHPSVPGPPPETPTPQASDALDRVARKRKQAELLNQAREVRASPTKSKTLLQKRFWKDVVVKETPEGFQVFLDSRPVRTPSKEILTLPSSKHQLATAIALEWDLLLSAQQALKTHYIPMTSLAARAVDIENTEAEGNTKIRGDTIDMLMRYLSTDTLLCWAEEKSLHDAQNSVPSLRKAQMEAAFPIIAYLTTHVWPGVEIKPILEPDSIMPIAQPDMTQAVLRGWLTNLPAFELAGLERAVLASKSLLVGVRLVHEWGEAFAQARGAGGAARFGIQDAADAASLEVRWQTRQWGEVEDTHDVEKEDMKRQLGNAVLLVGGENA
ncbi:hypothetical protein BDV95DRAFT_508303 [Massariosphaeria phaeospora]|uniref:ATP12-domain-containing protein n=1 Tax=Massariosphaeria phaeospora TaxID=100035 RepID=A0A7C8M190_9PLEO|nr:hypothetical protein BDV95DRAFT_508303 [Massariosphaeria phaeospora]